MRHKWNDNVCVQCGIKRKRKHWKQLMAIVNHPPWNAYMHGCDMAYSTDEFKTWVWEAPKCNPVCTICGLSGFVSKCDEHLNCLTVSMEEERRMKRLGII